MCDAIVMLPYLDVYVRVTDLVVFFAKMEGIDEDGDVLHAILFSSSNTVPSGRHIISWEDCVRNVVAVPAKVANYMGERRDVPSVLEHGPYFADVSIRTEHLVFVSRTERSQG